MSVASKRHTLGDDADEPLSTAFRSELSNRYEIEREIGRGGMATVWLARDRADGRAVAIKVMRSSVAQSVGVRRFVREIRIASEVRAPSLIPLEESGEVDGVPYYVMPFASGGSLRQRLEHERYLSVPDALRIATAVSAALIALHQHGFVHRDIKPENVLLTEDGEPMLADYGIARALTASVDDVTSTGVVVGTPVYMSPEQSSGDPVDARSDQYSLGCLLYEMLAGVPPFHGASAQAVIARHQQDAPPSLRTVRNTVPPSLEAIVMRTLSKVAADRYGSVADLLTALESVDLTATVRWPWLARRFARRHRRGLAAGLVVVGAAGAIYSVRPRAPLDPTRVVVFPLAETDSGAPSREGEELALLIGSALDRAEGALWMDGTEMLSAQERADPRGVNAARMRELVRSKGARYAVTGHVSRRRDSTFVQMVARDASIDDPIAQVTERGGAGVPVGDLTLRAVVRMLPKLTGLDRVVDVSGIIGRQPAAVDDWLMGEREYRGSNMESALRYLEAAVKTDSLLAPAAFRAAVAATWTNRSDTAFSFIRLALRHADALSPQQKTFARAFERFLAGRADEAIVELRPLLQGTRESAGAWMLAGEIQIHLLPTIDVDPRTLNGVVPRPTLWPLEARAEQAFVRARTLDPGFSPPLAHLTEIAARRGNAGEVVRLSRELERTKDDSVFVQRMQITERCLRKGVGGVDWRAEARRSTLTLYRVGSVLEAASDPLARRCAMSAFAAVLRPDTGEVAESWGSLVALHGMLVASGRTETAIHLVDSAVTRGMTIAVGLHVLDAAAGLPELPSTGSFAAQLFEKVDTRPAPSLWLLTIWYAHVGDANRLERIARAADSLKRATGQRVDSLVADISAAYLALARRDTTMALKRFAALRPTAIRKNLEGVIWEGLVPERLEYARLLLARGDPAGAHRVASSFDSPAVPLHQLFLPASLELRARAARALADTSLERSAQMRLAVLADSSSH